jgi:hypothetical protein
MRRAALLGLPATTALAAIIPAGLAQADPNRTPAPEPAAGCPPTAAATGRADTENPALLEALCERCHRDAHE